MKRGQVAIFVIVSIILVVGISLSFVLKNPSQGIECSQDLDCVPSSCCHAESCVPVSQAPNCEGTFCTTDCRPGTLDCGQASCSCINNRCAVK